MFSIKIVVLKLLSDLNQVQKLMPKIKKIAKKENAIFLGISPDNNKDYPRYGVTVFKLKFRG